MVKPEVLAWFDGKIVPENEPPEALIGGAAGGCYTTARIQAGRLCLAERHSRRLRRDSLRLGIEAPATALIQRAESGVRP